MKVNNLTIRSGGPSDHSRILAVMPGWWGGRDLSDMLLKLFFIHFRDTIFIVERESELVGFLLGFYSQTLPDEAYIHFVGVHPDLRGQGLGRTLYEHFFELCKSKGRSIVHSCTSPINKGSIEFHKRMGFEIEPGDGEIEDVPVTLDYHRPGEAKVQFRKCLDCGHR
jgi:ribosomal protein S18 acetylase RimI-like enzyme